MNEPNIFSGWFEDKLLSMLAKLFDRFVEIQDQDVPQGFIRRENAMKYYDGIGKDTLVKYENLGLGRYQPIEGSLVYYSVKELNNFMFRYKM